MRPVPGSPGALGIVSRFRFAGGAETGSGREIALPGWHATRVSSWRMHVRNPPEARSTRRSHSTRSGDSCFYRLAEIGPFGPHSLLPGRVPLASGRTPLQWLPIARRASHTDLPGVHTQGATPDPIPNSAVKPLGPMILPHGGKVGQRRAFPSMSHATAMSRGSCRFCAPCARRPGPWRCVRSAPPMQCTARLGVGASSRDCVAGAPRSGDPRSAHRRAGGLEGGDLPVMLHPGGPVLVAWRRGGRLPPLRAYSSAG